MDFLVNRLHTALNKFWIHLNLKYQLIDLSKIERIGDTVRLDASTICQLKCPTCQTSQGINKEGVIGKGYLTFENFKRFVENNPQIKRIELACWGEMFLNPELKQIIQYAYSKKVMLSAKTGVNFNNVSEEMMEDLVKYKFRSILISIDGATNESYQKFRINGDFNKVITNIKKLNYYKKKYNSKYPILVWQFILFGHNIHEVSTARKIAKSLGMTFTTKLNSYHEFSPIRKHNEFEVSKEKIKKKYKRMYSSACLQLWTDVQINWDGKLLGCSENTWGDFGNVFESGLSDCIKSERYNYAKKLILGKEEPRGDIPCSQCPVYKKFYSKSPIS